MKNNYYLYNDIHISYISVHVKDAEFVNMTY